MKDSAKPDLKARFPFDNLKDGGMTLGQVDGEDVILARRGDELFAVGAACTHYHGPLAEGLLVDETVRCPWHHACFSLRTGEALRAPALDPVSCWHVEQRDGAVYVGTKVEAAAPGLFRPHHHVERRFVRALRSPQSFQGLPLRRCGVGVNAAQSGDLLPG